MLEHLIRVKDEEVYGELGSNLDLEN